MSTRTIGVVLVVALVGCSSESEEAPLSPATSDVVTLRQLDHDFDIPTQSLPLETTFAETLSSHGITVRPSLTASGIFGLANGHVHVQADYVPSRIVRLDVSASGDWSATARLDFDVAVDPSWASYSADFRRRFVTGTSLGGNAIELGSVPLGAVPLPQAPGLELAVVLELAAACELDFDADLRAHVELGMGGLASFDAYYDEELPQKVGALVNGGLTPRERFHVTTPPRFAFDAGNQANLHGRCSLEPSINVMVTTLGLWPLPATDVGVKIIVEPYADFRGTFHSLREWSVDTTLGVEANISPFGDFFGHHWEQANYVTLFDYELARKTTTP